jgi:YaiO family outer membrane protein
MGYGRDDFSFASAANLSFVTASYSSPRKQYAFQYERWNKFGEEVDRGGASVTARLGDHVWLRGSAMFAPGARVLARQDYSAGLSRSLPRGFVIGGDYRRLQLRDAHVDVASPGFEYYLASRPVWVQAIVSESWTQVDEPVQARAPNPSMLLRYNQQLSNAFLMHLGYARGQESFATLSIDQLGRFRANTYSASVDIRMRPAWALGLSYAHQQRSSGSRQRTVGVNVSVRE